MYDLATDTMRLSADASRIFGLSEGTANSYGTYLARVHSQDQTDVDRAWRAALTGGVFDHEHRIVVGDATRWIRQNTEPELASDGTPLQVISIAHEITQRKQAEAARALLEAQLHQSQKMKAIGTLAEGIAHDFNNIVTAILGNTELAHYHVSNNPLAQESLREIRKAGIRARDLVQQIVSFSRGQPTGRKPTALTPIVEESARLLRATLPARLALEVHCAADVPIALADAPKSSRP